MIPKSTKRISDGVVILDGFGERQEQGMRGGMMARPMPRDIVLRHLREFERITLRHALFDNVTTYFNIAHHGASIEMHIDAQVPDRETGKKTPLHARYEWSVEELEHHRGMDFKLYIVRHELRKFLEHELDEMLNLDGKQLKDPHANDPPRPPDAIRPT